MNVERSFSRPSVTLILALLAACSTAPPPYMGSPERGQMLAHFDLAVEMRGYAIHGDLERFRETAARLDDLDPADDLSPDVILQLGPMRWEARAGASARSIEDAARATAEVARTCGDCHLANEVALAGDFVLTMPSPRDDAQRHMAGLEWVTGLLWEGLVAPSEAAWAVGAEGLREAGATAGRASRGAACARCAARLTAIAASRDGRFGGHRDRGPSGRVGGDLGHVRRVSREHQRSLISD